LSINCQSNVLYKVISDGFRGIIKKKCRICTKNGWTDFRKCERLSCDKHDLNGEFKLQTFYSKLVSNEQDLFYSDEVVAIYQFSNEKVCKLCQLDGEWSKYAESSLCIELTTPRPNQFCTYENLKSIEYKQFDYVRLRIESSNGLYKLDEQELEISNRLEPNTVVVYQRYLSQLTTTKSSFSFNSYEPTNPYTKKFCRYCDNGNWSEIESCVWLNCEKELLTGSPDLLLIENNEKPIEQQTLFRPHSILAIYSFGSEKFCKQCHNNGEWSRYSLSELCKLQTYSAQLAYNFRTTRKKLARERENLAEFYQLESSCSLFKLKNEFSMVVYRLNSTDKSVLDIKWCRKCINGKWNEIYAPCPIEYSIKKCKPKNLRAFNYLVYVSDKEHKFHSIFH
jgi:hypothetical protein